MVCVTDGGQASKRAVGQEGMGVIVGSTAIFASKEGQVSKGANEREGVEVVEGPTDTFFSEG